MLQRYESFRPKRMDDREVGRKILADRKFKEIEHVYNKLSEAIANLKNVTSEDPLERMFIKDFKNVEIKYDLLKIPDMIFLFNGDKYLAEYQVDTHVFGVHFSRIYTKYVHSFTIKELDSKIKKCSERYLNLPTFYVDWKTSGWTNYVEQTLEEVI